MPIQLLIFTGRSVKEKESLFSILESKNYEHPPIPNDLRKKPHSPEAKQKILRPNSPQGLLTGAFVVVGTIGDDKEIGA